ncbi:hypothetical protein BGZ61DRAFT_35229 [Ilyonectria robusta]|uniref:uncharacterized protein n=1 Tax=Ilyonectria robusta TaxID=1079257 RepID=UPI001E8DD709|nr:uncharacterized protein BGZ61DRAFT_35229 [Ilyonectria robusta]KAH8694742.1 hypothetical protein BGZ61DRAFT_35229 [Ilyonectria robusta]
MAITAAQCLAAEWSLFTLAFLFVVARLGVRVWQRKWSFWLADLFLVLALLPFLALVIGDTCTLLTGRGLFEEPTSAGWGKWKFASAILYDATFYFPRFSLLAFYNQLFPVSEPNLRRCLYFVAAFTVCAFLQAMFTDLFWCGANIAENWSSDTASCALWRDVTTLYISWPLGLVSEILVFALPFRIIPKLRSLQKRERTGLISIFLLGAATVIVSIARLALLIQGLLRYTTYLVALTEMATQIIVTVLPTLRPLLKLSWCRISSQTGQTEDSRKRSTR